MVTFQGHFDAGEESSKFIMEPLISFYRGCLKKDQTGHDGFREGLKKMLFLRLNWCPLPPHFLWGKKTGAYNVDKKSRRHY